MEQKGHYTNILFIVFFLSIDFERLLSFRCTAMNLYNGATQFQLFVL
jgi:hypothetical protein